MRIFMTILAICGSLAAAIACSAPQAADAPAPARQPKARSVQELMLTQIDPAADALWAAVSTISDASGVHENQPRSGAEWAALRRSAQQLIAGSDALMVKGLPVVVAGEAPPQPAAGDETPTDVALSQDIQKAIDRKPCVVRAACAAVATDGGQRTGGHRQARSQGLVRPGRGNRSGL
jgi:hypothetical protein